MKAIVLTELTDATHKHTCDSNKYLQEKIFLMWFFVSLSRVLEYERSSFHCVERIDVWVYHPERRSVVIRC